MRNLVAEPLTSNEGGGSKHRSISLLVPMLQDKGLRARQPRLMMTSKVMRTSTAPGFFEQVFEEHCDLALVRSKETRLHYALRYTWLRPIQDPALQHTDADSWPFHSEDPPLRVRIIFKNLHTVMFWSLGLWVAVSCHPSLAFAGWRWRTRSNW